MTSIPKVSAKRNTGLQDDHEPGDIGQKAVNKPKAETSQMEERASARFRTAAQPRRRRESFERVPGTGPATAFPAATRIPLLRSSALYLDCSQT
jgi:hypothetical protein